ncbi:hypothetical protein [Paraburkholderia sediminicola]|uniref:hypothetical protein n=1 Tax=Paraburkholderia sediminicola TaxID=458836 RepID=UPI0038BB8BB7
MRTEADFSSQGAVSPGRTLSDLSVSQRMLPEPGQRCRKLAFGIGQAVVGDTDLQAARHHTARAIELVANHLQGIVRVNCGSQHRAPEFC